MSTPNCQLPTPKAILALLLAVSAATVAAQQPTPQRAPGTLREGVTAVLVDVVVRDRRGQPVRDLTQADFEVLENGVSQPIGSFTPVFRGGTTSAAAAPSASTPPAASAGAAAVPAPGVNDGPGVTALVFHSLSPDGRRRAVQAARAYVGTQEETMGNYVAIFGLDLSMAPLVPFTRNAVALRAALDTMAARSSASFNSPEQREQRTNAERQAALAAAATAAGESAGPGASAAIGGSPGDAQLAQMAAGMLRDFEGMERDQQGYAATNGLFSIVKTLGRLPGRKNLVLFSEGIEIPAAVHRLFLGVIDAANRANVSIYTIDSAGLRADSSQLGVSGMVNMGAAAGFGSYSADGVSDAYTKNLEANEYALRSDPQTGLGQLARDTGGLLFRDSNNIPQALERADTDMRNYYLLGYTPTNAAFDGRFRSIQVKVKRPNVTVAARKGYFAVRDPGGSIVNEWEAPALGAFEQKPVPNAFPIRAAALYLPERGRPGLVPVVVDFKTAPLTFAPTDDRKTYSSDFAVLVRFIDQNNQVIRKVSQHYDVTGPIGEIERAKLGDVVFYRESELAPGVYTMESIVYDTPSGKSSVRFSTVEVPKEPDGRLRMSSLVIVKRAEKVAPKSQEKGADNSARPAGPLVVGDAILRPNLGEPVSKAAKEIGFYFSVYGAPGTTTPESVIHLLQNDKVIARLPVPSAAADATGRIQQVGRLPLDQLSPGTYEMRAIVKQGSEQVFRSTMVTITE